MIYVDTRGLSHINNLLKQKINVLVLCPNGVSAAEWLKKIEYLPMYNQELCKVKMSLKVKYPTIISKEGVAIFPEFIKKNLTSDSKRGIK